MSSSWRHQDHRSPWRHGDDNPEARQPIRSQQSRSGSGFTLVELLIVVTIIPLIVGGLSVGLLSVFKLQSSVSNRLGDTGDSQVVSSYFDNDVQSAASVTTAPSNTSAECGPSTEVQLVGLKWSPTTGGGGDFQTVVSYAEVQIGSTWTLVRQYCSSGYSNTSFTTTVISPNPPPPCTTVVTANCQNPPTISSASSVSPSAATLAAAYWTSTQSVTKVEFPLAEPNSTEKNGQYLYTLAAVPAASEAIQPTGGSAFNPSTTAGCNFATPNTGYYASNLCFVDFSSLTGNNLLAAEQSCLEMSVALPGGSTLYFCIGISGSAVEPFGLPTWSNAFLGNTCSNSSNNQNCTNGSPFYTGIGGEPALYQTAGGVTTITISNITVLNAQDVPATGWEAVGADAESTDSNEWIQWTSDTPLALLSNNGTPTAPYGSACGGGISYSNSPAPNTYLTIRCTGQTTSIVKTGTAMVWATTPTTFTTSMNGNGLEAMAFGLLVS
jgi:prepilin-type N-terminal cleavage/methylation domain-containing protein